MTPLEARIRNAAEEMAAQLADKGRMTIAGSHMPTADASGVVAWRAALRLIMDGRALKVSDGLRRITRGPRPHIRFRMVMEIKKIPTDFV